MGKKRETFKALCDSLLNLHEMTGLSVTQLARQVGISHNTLSNYESGNRAMDALTLKKIAEATDVSADFLLGISRKELSDNERQIIASEYTGLSSAAIKTLHQYAHLRENASDILDNFSEFIVRYYSDFLARLADLQDAVAAAEEIEKTVAAEAALISKMNALRDSSEDKDQFNATFDSTFPVEQSEDLANQLNSYMKIALVWRKGEQIFKDFERQYKDLTLRLFEFSKLCDEIPEGLFESNAVYERLRQIATANRLLDI